MPKKPVEPPEGGSLRAHLIKGASGSFLLQVGFAGLAFLNSVILARWLGADGYGAYSGAMAWMILLLIPAVLGFDTLLVRDAAIYRSRQDWGKLTGLLSFSIRLALVASTLSAALLAATAYWGFSAPDKQSLRHALYFAALLLPIMAMLKISGSTLRGLERVILANLPDLTLRPALLLLGLLLTVAFWPERLTAPMAMAINTAAAVAALSVSFFWLKNNLTSLVGHARPEYCPKPWLMAALPMLVYGGSQTVLGQTDIAMLTAMRGLNETGLYTAANRLAFLLVFATMATGFVLAPVMARLYEAGEKDRLQIIITKAVRISFIAVLPFGLALIFFGHWFLGIFGTEFVAGWPVLVILTMARLADVALGAGALLLTMTGNERLVAVVFAAAAFVNIALNALLIPRYGAEGAAIASVISLVAVKITLVIYSAKRTDLRVSIIGRHLSLRRTDINGAL